MKNKKLKEKVLLQSFDLASLYPTLYTYQLNIIKNLLRKEKIKKIYVL